MDTHLGGLCYQRLLNYAAADAYTKKSARAKRVNANYFNVLFKMSNKKGVIKMFSEEGGLGFIARPRRREDVYFNQRELADGYKPQVGDEVSFEERPSRVNRNKFEATNVQFLGQKSYVGTVDWFNGTYGALKNDKIRDVFLHRNVLGDDMPLSLIEQGAQLSFTVQPSRRRRGSYEVRTAWFDFNDKSHNFSRSVSRREYIFERLSDGEKLKLIGIIKEEGNDGSRLFLWEKGCLNLVQLGFSGSL